MILHFSHIGLTDVLTFVIRFGDWVPARRLWLPLRPPLPPRGEALVRVRNSRLRAEPLILATPRPPQLAPGGSAGPSRDRPPAPRGALGAASKGSQPGRASSS